jgi:glycosyltransferase involved in cell wall biosynthesis
MKILAFGDSVRMQSGYGRMSQNILSYFARQGHQIRQIGWQHMEPPERVELLDLQNKSCGELELWPPHTMDQYATMSTVHHAVAWKPDLIYASNDIFSCAELVTHKKVILDNGSKFFLSNYGVIDSDTAGDFFSSILQQIDVPVTPSKFGYNQTSRINPNSLYIPHGVNLNIYKLSALPKEIIKMKYSCAGKFIFGAVNRNVSRKMYGMIFKAFSILKHVHKLNNIVLYCVTDPTDKFGENFFELARIHNLTISWKNQPADVMIHPHHQSHVISLDEPTLAEAYNMFDVLVSASVGEGFGLSTLEGAACGTPSIMCRHSANVELVDGHGWLYPTIKLSNGDELRFRSAVKETAYDFPLPDSYELEKAMLDSYNNSEKLRDYSKKCIDFAQQYSWTNVLKLWDTVLERAQGG